MPITPKAEAALERLAKLTVEKGWDPGKVIASLVRQIEIMRHLNPEERRTVIAELRRRGHVD